MKNTTFWSIVYDIVLLIWNFILIDLIYTILEITSSLPEYFHTRAYACDGTIVFSGGGYSLSYKNVSMYILIEHGIWGEWGKWEFWKCNPTKGCLKKRRQPCIGTKPCDGKEPQQSECKFDEYSYLLVHIKVDL